MSPQRRCSSGDGSPAASRSAAPSVYAAAYDRGSVPAPGHQKEPRLEHALVPTCGINSGQSPRLESDQILYLSAWFRWERRNLKAAPRLTSHTQNDTRGGASSGGGKYGDSCDDLRRCGGRAGLALSLKMFVLIPATGLAVAIVAADGIACGDGVWQPAVAGATIATSLQLGFLGRGAIGWVQGTRFLKFGRRPVTSALCTPCGAKCTKKA